MNRWREMAERWLGGRLRPHAMETGTSANPPSTGRLLAPRAADRLRDYPSAGLTPSRLTAILREADEGSLSSAMQLFEEMEEKDPHLFAVANVRRLALTGLDWQVTPATGMRNERARRLAEEAAAYCRERLASMSSFDEALQHLSLAVGRNIAIAEIVWDVVDGAVRPAALAPVDFTRIVFDESDRPRILTDEARDEGIEPAANKFIVHAPHSTSGHPQRGGLLRVTALAYLAKNFAMKDWMIFAEVFGMPLRIARYEPSTSAEEKRELLRMMEELGSHAAGVFSSAVELQVIESKRTGQTSPYQALIEFLNREISKAWLGQTLTTDITGQRGSLTASQVHEQVRQDVLADDMRKEGRTIRRDLLGPMTRMEFGPDAPVPMFRRRPKPTAASMELVELVDRAVNRLGLSVPEGWLRESLALPEGVTVGGGNREAGG